MSGSSNSNKRKQKEVDPELYAQSSKNLRSENKENLIVRKKSNIKPLKSGKRKVERDDIVERKSSIIKPPTSVKRKVEQDNIEEPATTTIKKLKRSSLFKPKNSAAISTPSTSKATTSKAAISTSSTSKATISVEATTSRSKNSYLPAFRNILLIKTGPNGRPVVTQLFFVLHNGANPPTIADTSTEVIDKNADTENCSATKQ